ncbi:hypothetical protein CDV31_003515 [Fusarium ambrosium]|uniref:Uncharacterized protein n=1 Tax=Fusarium ambrosium TaxID=131363 RepID=A0A428UTJ7_9HYPO|nr:hypothetical protein CDV31_003515 [Fusarium ambrosium]
MKQDHDWSVSATSDHCQDPQPTRFQGMDLDAELPTADGANWFHAEAVANQGPKSLAEYPVWDNDCWSQGHLRLSTSPTIGPENVAEPPDGNKKPSTASNSRPSGILV